MATTLLNKGFQGVIAVLLPTNKKEAKKLTSSLGKFEGE